MRRQRAKLVFLSHAHDDNADATPGHEIITGIHHWLQGLGFLVRMTSRTRGPILRGRPELESALADEVREAALVVGFSSRAAHESYLVNEVEWHHATRRWFCLLDKEPLPPAYRQDPSMAVELRDERAFERVRSALEEHLWELGHLPFRPASLDVVVANAPRDEDTVNVDFDLIIQTPERRISLRDGPYEASDIPRIGHWLYRQLRARDADPCPLALDEYAVGLPWVWAHDGQRWFSLQSQFRLRSLTPPRHELPVKRSAVVKVWNQGEPPDGWFASGDVDPPLAADGEAGAIKLRDAHVLACSEAPDAAAMDRIVRLRPFLLLVCSDLPLTNLHELVSRSPVVVVVPAALAQDLVGLADALLQSSEPPTEVCRQWNQSHSDHPERWVTCIDGVDAPLLTESSS